MNDDITFKTPVSPEVEARTRRFYALAEQYPRNDEALLPLAEAGIALDAKSKSGYTPLHWAARKGLLPLCRELIRQKADVRAKDVDGSEPLHLAAGNGDNDICLALIDAGADVNAQGLLRNTPLHYAAHCANTDTCRLLMERHADKYALDDNGWSALHKAAMRNGDTCRYLLSQGLDPNALSKKGQTPLHIAACRGSTIHCNDLLLAGASVHIKDTEGRTPLFGILAYKHLIPDLYDRLIACGADSRVRDNKGQTVLHYCIERTSESCEKLLAYDFDLNARTDDGTTVLGMATRYKPNLIKAIVEKGANIYTKTRGVSLASDLDYWIDEQGIGRKGAIHKPDIQTDLSKCIKDCTGAYDRFQRTALPPKTTAEFCRILAATPLADPDVPIDQQAHLRQLFSYAKWQPGQAAEMAQALHEHGTVTTAFAEELTAIGEPRKTRSLEIGGRAR